MAETTAIDIKRLLSSMRLGELKAAPTPMVKDDLKTVTEDVSDEDRFLSGLAALVLNCPRSADGKFDKAKILESIKRIDTLINVQVNEIIHHQKYQALESTWRGLDDLIQHTNFKADIQIDILDVGKDELADDFETNAADLAGGSLFKKAYVAEYDQYGGKPYGSIIGLYSFEYTPKELYWLRQMGKVAAVAHAPFIASVSPKFFGCNTIEEIAAIKDLEGMLSQPKYGAWSALRDTPEAAYVGLCLPKYLLRLPWHPEKNPGGELAFYEEVNGNDDTKFLWGNPAILFARNMCRSFETSGWCQSLRGPKGGGLVAGLPAHMFNIRGEDEVKLPVEMATPDFRELEYANAGFIPVIYRKGSADVCFFSSQSIKKPVKFKDPKDSENSQLVTNLSYTFSITRIAHYLKCMMRDNIGSTADGPYVKSQISNWLSNYITKVPNPDDLTLKYYPFKAVTVDVQKVDGMVGFFSCQVSVLPHIQFEGMDIELRLESRL